MSIKLWIFLITFSLGCFAAAEDIKYTELYSRIKTSLDSVAAIDTHDHLQPFVDIPNRVETSKGRGMTLYSIWAGSYLRRTTAISPWPEDGSFDSWWDQAQDDFDDARATSFYRYLLPAFRDLYGIDFDTITRDEARSLNDRIFENYQNDQWLKEIITDRANIELMLIDPYWNRLQFAREYKFSVPVFNVTTIMRGSHPGQFSSSPESDNPFVFARRKGMETKNLDDFLEVIEALFGEAKASGAVCLKSTQAYQRSLSYGQVSKDGAAAIYGKSPKEITAQEQMEFEDFMFWRVCELSAKYELPFQIHTGDARIQDSSPMYLVDLIEANPKTKFILFHGGYPWVSETGAIAMKHKNVWIDSCWLPTLSYTMAKRAYAEWLEALPSDRILWGADTVHAEGIYGATEFTRECLAEVLSEKVQRGELREEHAKRIGRQILRDNALKLFPQLKALLWR
ncbi:MAG: amidohydrolase family protein [Verrucomicrobia bacterium]|nr:amidohydrolase family protein [Verrucomicrobiota bacterium]